MANESDIVLKEDGVKITGAGQSPEVEIQGGNHWNLAAGDGDVRIGDPDYNLKMGVALGGAGAGNVAVWATGKLKLGSEGESAVIVDGDGIKPDGGRNLGSAENRWNKGHFETGLYVGSTYEGLGSEGVLISKELTQLGNLHVADGVMGDLSPRQDGVNLGDSDRRWGTLYVQNVDQASDRRLKTAVEDFDGGLEAVLSLRPVSFRWRENGEQTHLGLVGQEVAEVLPEVVSEPDDDDEPVGVRYSELVPALVDAVQTEHAEKQRLADRVERQQQQLDAQQQLLDELQERLAALEEPADE